MVSAFREGNSIHTLCILSFFGGGGRETKEMNSIVVGKGRMVVVQTLPRTL